MKIFYCPYCAEPGWLSAEQRNTHVREIHGKMKPAGSCEMAYLRKVRKEISDARQK